MFNETPCPVCGSADYNHFLKGRDLNLNLPGTYVLVRCTKCGLVYLNPRPTTTETLSTFYPDLYDQYTVALDEDGWLRRLDRMYGLWKRFRFVQTRVPFGGCLLDIGCATGDFIHYVQHKQGWEAHGIELNTHAASIAQKKLSVRIIGRTLEDTDIPPASYEAVTMWNVFEHVINPRQTIRNIHQILKPDGWLILNMPNLDAHHARLFGIYWIGYEIPRHLNLFNTKSLESLLNEIGFRVDHTVCLYGSYFAFMSSIQFYLRDNFRQHTRLLRIVDRFLFSYPMRLILSPYFLLSDKMKWSTSITLIAQRENLP